MTAWKEIQCKQVRTYHILSFVCVFVGGWEGGVGTQKSKSIPFLGYGSRGEEFNNSYKIEDKMSTS